MSCFFCSGTCLWAYMEVQIKAAFPAFWHTKLLHMVKTKTLKSHVTLKNMWQQRACFFCLNSSIPLRARIQPLGRYQVFLVNQLLKVWIFYLHRMICHRTYECPWKSLEYDICQGIGQCQASWCPLKQQQLLWKKMSMKGILGIY